METSPSIEKQRSKLYAFVRFPMMIVIVGCLSSVYAFIAVAALLPLLLAGTQSLSLSGILPFRLVFIAITPAIAFGLTSMLFWYRLVLRKQQWTLKRGLLVGFLSTLLAHPVMFLLAALIQDSPTLLHPDSIGRLLSQLLTTPILSIFEIILFPLFWLATLIIGAAGAGVAGWLVGRIMLAGQPNK